MKHHSEGEDTLTLDEMASCPKAVVGLLLRGLGDGAAVRTLGRTGVVPFYLVWGKRRAAARWQRVTSQGSLRNMGSLSRGKALGVGVT